MAQAAGQEVLRGYPRVLERVGRGWVDVTGGFVGNFLGGVCGVARQGVGAYPLICNYMT